MDYNKIDTGLAAALSRSPAAAAEEEPRLNVFIRTAAPPDPSQQSKLAELGVHGVERGRNVFSARITRQSLEDIVSLPWIDRVSLAQSLRPLGR